jgi:TetR/AcrR family transcriptional regulator, mexJK operon transcriptional repressor
METPIAPKNTRRGRPINEARRDQIIAVANRLFGSLGLHATTMEQIAKELRVSKLTLYKRFADKEALFSEVIKHNCQSYIPDDFLEGHCAEALTTEEALYRFAYSLMTLLTSDGPINMERMLMTAEPHLRSSLTAIYYEAGPKRVKDLLTTYLTKLNEAKKLIVPDPIFSADVLIASIKGCDICIRAQMHLMAKATPEQISSYCRHAVQLFIKSHHPMIRH